MQFYSFYPTKQTQNDKYERKNDTKIVNVCLLTNNTNLKMHSIDLLGSRLFDIKYITSVLR